MRNLGGLISLLLIAAIIFLPTENPSKVAMVSPLTVSGDTADFTPQAENENDTVKIIAAVIIIIFIIYCIADMEQDQSKEVKADWK